MARDRINRPLTESRECIRTNQIPAVKATVEAVNELGKELGFTLQLGVEPSAEFQDSSDITLTPSQRIHSDFFSGMGVFWSTEMSVFVGTRMVDQVSAKDAKVIFMAQMAGINTMQLIANELDHPSNPDKAIQWRTVMNSLLPSSL